jgi:hypothetical protein
MKNKDFIKKSIEDNIVDSNMVLNNIKAKAAVLESSRAYARRSGVGLRRVGVLAVLLVLAAACVMSCIYLFDPDDGAVPPVVDNSFQIKSDKQDSCIQKNCSEKTTSKSENNSKVTVSKQPDIESREPKSESECSDMISQILLDGETKVFFENFSDNFAVFQNLFNARLQNSGTVTDGYSEVKDTKYDSFKDIKDFLYSFMEPKCAGEIYIGLTCGDKPYYIEKDGFLYELADASDNKIEGIKTDKAFLSSKSNDTLVITTMLKTSNGQDHYDNFEFVKKNGEWLYSGVWKTPEMFTNNTNFK